MGFRQVSKFAIGFDQWQHFYLFWGYKREIKQFSNP
jgi:hypothetical protein